MHIGSGQCRFVSYPTGSVADSRQHSVRHRQPARLVERRMGRALRHPPIRPFRDARSRPALAPGSRDRPGSHVRPSCTACPGWPWPRNRARSMASSWSSMLRRWRIGSVEPLARGPPGGRRSGSSRADGSDSSHAGNSPPSNSTGIPSIWPAIPRWSAPKWNSRRPSRSDGNDVPVRAETLVRRAVRPGIGRRTAPGGRRPRARARGASRNP